MLSNSYQTFNGNIDLHKPCMVLKRYLDELCVHSSLTFSSEITLKTTPKIVKKNDIEMHTKIQILEGQVSLFFPIFVGFSDKQHEQPACQFKRQNSIPFSLSCLS